MPKVTKGKNTQKSNEPSEKPGKPEKKERCSYSVDQKQIVVEYALKHGRNAAARLYKIDKSMVGRWVKASEKWNADPTKVNWNSLRVGSGQKPLYEEAENQLHKWVSDQHRMGVEITNSNVRNKMYQILKQSEMKALYPDAEKEFKASSRWLSGFLTRKKLTVLRDRPVFKKRPICDVVLREYRQNIKRLRKGQEFEFRNLLDMDELPVWFDTEGNLRVNLRREKEMKIPDTFFKFTILLTCAADGTKYSPICVFRGTELPYGEKVPDGVIVWFHEDGIMSQELMFNYIDMLHVIRMMNNQSNKPAIMVHDKSIDPDPDGPIHQKFASHNISLEVIPNGTMLSVLQPIDIINKIFKDNLIKEWDKWNAITGIIRRATITDICGWVKNAWEEISKEIIFDSFKKCRISSALNGSEDKVKFPTVDPIIKEIKADDAVQRSQSQNGGFNREYTMETEAEEVSNNNDEKMNEKANEGPVTEIHAIFDEYVFAETDQLTGTSAAFVPLNPETVHPDHTQSSHMQPSILRSDLLPSTHVSTNQVNRHSNYIESTNNVNSARSYYR